MSRCSSNCGCKVLLSSINLKTLFILSVIFHLLLINLLVVAQKRVVDKRVFLKLDSLPESFTNEKLPTFNKQNNNNNHDDNKQENQKCYNFIGCFERIPITSLPQDPQDLKTEFRIYTNNGQEALIDVGQYEVCLQSKTSECDRYPFDLQQLLEVPFDAKQRTIIIVGGYFSKAPSNWEVRVKDLWLKLNSNVNVIIVGWVGGNSGLYSTASINTRPVARQLTVLLYYLGKLHGFELNNFDGKQFAGRIYMVGHSLGAHIAAFVGQDLNGQLGRITGLDPAGPQFDALPKRFRLDRGDANLVDIMHTNAGSSIFSINSQYGSALASGHLDLYANDGRHQPACSNDLLGCSHKKANAYYESYLNHELSMREYLNCNQTLKFNCKQYRLRAYASQSYDDFHNGLSLKKLCPITVLDDRDLLNSDLDKCSIPIDYVTWFDELKEELQLKNGINFNNNSTANGDDDDKNKYYFYPNENSDTQSDHYLIKIRMSKCLTDNCEADTKIDSKINYQQSKTFGCDFNLDIEMENGLKNKYVVTKYQPIDEADHFEIIVPFLSPNFVTKYELVKLDSNDFFNLNENEKINKTSKVDKDKNFDEEKLRISLGKVLPNSIKITGLNSNNIEDDDDSRKQLQPKKKNSIIGFVKKLFGMAKESVGEQFSKDKKQKLIDPRCNLPIESFTVQPLRKMHRHLAAFYSREHSVKPEVIILKTFDEHSPKLNLIQQAATAAAAAATAKVNEKLGEKNVGEDELQNHNNDGVNILYKHKIIVGPYDSSIDELEPDDNQEDSLKLRRSVATTSNLVAPKTWLTVALSSCILIVLMLIISIITTSKSKSNNNLDEKQVLVFETQSTAQQASELIIMGQQQEGHI